MLPQFFVLHVVTCHCVLPTAWRGTVVPVRRALGIRVRQCRDTVALHGVVVRRHCISTCPLMGLLFLQFMQICPLAPFESGLRGTLHTRSAHCGKCMLTPCLLWARMALSLLAPPISLLVVLRGLFGGVALASTDATIGGFCIGLHFGTSTTSWMLHWRRAIIIIIIIISNTVG